MIGWTPVSLFAALLVAALSAMPVRAADPEQQAGLIQFQTNPCLLAKYRKQAECELPPLPDTRDSEQLENGHLARARYYIDMEDRESALKEADAALDLNPGNVRTRHFVARLALSTGDYSRAERELRATLEQSPGDNDVRATWAVYLSIRGSPEAAIGEYDAILAKQPDHRFSRNERATVLTSFGRFSEAIADLDVLLVDKDDANLLSRRAFAYLMTNHPKKAIADLSGALQQTPGRSDLLAGRAAAYEMVGDDQAAVADYDTLMGPVGSPPKYAIGGDGYAKLRMRRALVLVRLMRLKEASSEIMDSLAGGGRPSILRAQTFLRRNGFPEAPLDGAISEPFKQALQSCFGLKSCFEKISGSL